MTEQLITHDDEHDVSYIYLFGKYPPGTAIRTVPVGNPDICLDFDCEGHLIGIELLGPGLLHPALKAVAVRPGQSNAEA